ncbi:protein kinase family protein [Kineococcus xinjiangensis]|uniref:protein kinase family protein n=1 Tax=Kineococcus xinjiangensis TaxID=512762 RepID=UPI000CEBCE71|nr:protein kinase family protein [Kineococcus xinjiangensis]
MARGSVADRYLLRQRLPLESSSQMWDAHDATLDRRVTVRTLPAADPRAEDFLDAARRAALVSEQRLPRVLDAGTDEDLAYVVEEHVDGVSLGELLAEGPLEPAAVRALVGEAAAALDAAARRGLHHARLTPESVLLCVDGQVRVLGTAMEGALELDPPHVSPVRAATLANRRDALGLVALVYAGLTGRWPAAEDVEPYPSLPPAPVDGAHGAPIPPKDLRPEVPNDLDTLCAVTFGPHEDGPRDPGELSLQLAPWSMAPWAGTLRRLRGEHAEREVRERLPSREEVPEAEPPAPFTAPEPTSSPPREQSRFVLGVVGACLAVGAVLAVWSLSGVLPDRETLTPARSETSASAAPATGEAAPSAPEPAEPEPAPEPAPPAPVLLPVTASAMDPLGDDDENGAQAAAVVDGDPATSWQSEAYSSPAFGGLKDGLGLLLDLGAEHDVTSVDVTAAGDGGRLELRTAPGPGLDGSVPVAESAAGGELRLAPEQPVRARYLVLWFTELPQAGGDNRADVAEVRVTGTPAAAVAGG